MMQILEGNQTKQRGGRRPGAGRKVKRIQSLVKRCDRATAAMILAVVDEQSKWQQFIESKDERIALDAMKFLTQMRDGRPKQQVAVDDARRAQEEADALVRGMTEDELVALALGISIDEVQKIRQRHPVEALRAQP